jgi:hypothetical protein
MGPARAAPRRADRYDLYVPEFTPHKLHARAEQNITVDVLTVATSITGILVGVIQGYKFLEAPSEKKCLFPMPYALHALLSTA